MHASGTLASTARLVIPSLLTFALAAPLRAEPPAEGAGFPVGTARIVVSDKGRELPVQLWYPAVDAARAEAEAGHPTAHFEPEGPQREKLQRLLDAANQECIHQTMHAAIDAEPRALDGALPVIAISHHMGGSRLSTYTINERLAQRGFVVAGIDHVGGTVFDLDPADLLSLMTAVTPQTVRTRATDLGIVLDALLDPAGARVPAGLRGRIDSARVGTYGHSMGGFAVGISEVEDARVKASAFLATVPAGGLPSLGLGTPAIPKLRVPAFYLHAQEDAVLALLGGAQAVRDAFQKQKAPAWMIEVRDLGHFGMADDLSIQGMNDGCGGAARIDKPRERYTNPSPALARDIAARYVTAFFAHRFLGASDAPLREAVPANLVITNSRP